MENKLNEQIKRTKESLRPDSLKVDGLKEVTILIEMFFEYIQTHINKEPKNG